MDYDKINGKPKDPVFAPQPMQQFKNEIRNC
jgi:hypothetical protein